MAFFNPSVLTILLGAGCFQIRPAGASPPLEGREVLSTSGCSQQRSEAPPGLGDNEVREDAGLMALRPRWKAEPTQGHNSPAVTEQGQDPAQSTICCRKGAERPWYAGGVLGTKGSPGCDTVDIL